MLQGELAGVSHLGDVIQFVVSAGEGRELLAGCLAPGRRGCAPGRRSGARGTTTTPMSSTPTRRIWCWPIRRPTRQKCWPAASRAASSEEEHDDRQQRTDQHPGPAGRRRPNLASALHGRCRWLRRSAAQPLLAACGSDDTATDTSAQRRLARSRTSSTCSPGVSTTAPR